MTTFLAQSKNGTLSLGTEYNKERFLDDLRKNNGAKYQIKRLTAESKKMRKFLHGAVYPLWAYLNDYDHRDSSVLRWLHEQAKLEFNAEIVYRDGKKVRKPRSTKGKLQEFTERVVEYLEEQYGIDRTQVLDTEHYKTFVDTVYSFGEYDTYIDYLIELGRLQGKK